MPKKIIYVAEDDISIRQLYEYAFDNREFEVMGFETAEELLDACEAVKPDVIIMDLMLPKMDGLAAINLLKSSRDKKDIPIIIISANGAETTKVKGFNSGADDYLEKPFGVLELAARVKRLIKRGEEKPQNLFAFRDLRVDASRHVVTVKGAEIDLTPKEFDILRLLAERKGLVVSRDEIFDVVWGENYFTETRTLDIHVQRIREKLKEASGEEYVRTVRGVGYILK